MRTWTDAGAHEYRRRQQRTGAQHDQFRRYPLDRSVRPLDLHACATAPLDDQSAHKGVCANRQIRSRTRRREITDRARHAQPAEFVHRLRTGSIGPRVVLVGAIRIAERARRLEERQMLRQQFRVRIATDRDRPGVAVIRRVAEVEVAFEALERRQNAVPRPRRIAEARPLVVVLRHAAQRDGGVHRARSAHHATTRK